MIALPSNYNPEEISMAKRPANNGASWSASELRTLKQLARSGTAQAAAKQLGRTPAAVQQKAMRTGISFRAAPARKKK
jgi:hypothetical protein